MPAKFSQRFGMYVLPGRITDPKRGIAEAIEAQSLGLGTVWVSERFGVKEGAALCGAIAQAAPQIKIAGTAHFSTRNPVVLASVASTLAALSDNRYLLVFARGLRASTEKLGAPHSTYKVMEDVLAIVRKLWAGETVSYQGPAGHFPQLKLADRYQGPPPPIVLCATSARTMEWAAQHCDGVLLSPMLTTQAVAEAVRRIHEAGKRAGRGPADCRIYSIVVSAPDVPAAEEEAIIGGRAVTYLQTSNGRLICQLNHWDPAVLGELAAHPTFAALRAGEHADQSFTRQQLVEASRVIPRHWLTDSAAVGTAAQCARRALEYVEAGADEIVLHGSSPTQFASMVGAIKHLLG